MQFQRMQMVQAKINDVVVVGHYLGSFQDIKNRWLYVIHGPGDNLFISNSIEPHDPSVFLREKTVIIIER